MFYNILNGLLFWGIQSNIREKKMKQLFCTLFVNKYWVREMDVFVSTFSKMYQLNLILYKLENNQIKTQE